MFKCLFVVTRILQHFILLTPVVAGGRARIVADDISANIKHKLTKEQKKVGAVAVVVVVMVIFCSSSSSSVMTPPAGCHYGSP